MKKYIFHLVFILLAVFYACEDKNEDELTLIYEESKCDNPWGEALLNQENYYVVIRSFLTENNIQIISVGTVVYDENVDQNCNPCDCITGRNIVLVVPVRDAEKAEELGFAIMD